MKKIQVIFPLIILLSLYSQIASSIFQRQKRMNSDRFKTEVRPAPRAPPADTSQYSIRINGQSNSVILNGKKMENLSDTTNTKNTIRVSGQGNTVSIIQDNQKSKVTITQHGKNNKINISQK